MLVYRWHWPLEKNKNNWFDISQNKLMAYRQGIDPTGEMESSAFAQI